MKNFWRKTFWKELGIGIIEGIKTVWKQFKCEHTYFAHRFGDYCPKCDKYRDSGWV